ncbi:MAG: CatB-related O-acetyltransferase [Sphingomonadaceae bacterium]|uniref:CatB-related O-acetyltransferase n=1 Tax=Thermaurantiacus sp. TaxID=2820283 RepID=UPI00298F28CB|nr:CatB-related O-acetyltransferase [Thermaurantiacus sp.]MCS6986455.1 CatB-related O-acetyltransferase [Sphingomonadaceae bacterium]MDW8414284.1 CatB-related O-acetyltransferase [Thermaurantiacus sp.]
MALLDTLIDRLLLKFAPGGEYESRWLRARFRRRHDLDIGLYSYGCFDRWRFPPGTTVGRYCSIAKSVRVVEADHPLDALTTHPFLYDPRFGLAGQSRLPVNRQVIEDDVWIGHNAIILPGCTRVGRGAAIAAGAIVRADVPRYAVMAGVPAKVVRFRFPPETIEAIEATRWWTLDKATLARGLAAVPEFAWRPDPESADRFHRAVHGRPLPAA